MWPAAFRRKDSPFSVSAPHSLITILGLRSLQSVLWFNTCCFCMVVCEFQRWSFKANTHTCTRTGTHIFLPLHTHLPNSILKNGKQVFFPMLCITATVLILQHSTGSPKELSFHKHHTNTSKSRNPFTDLSFFSPFTSPSVTKPDQIALKLRNGLKFLETNVLRSSLLGDKLETQPC